MLKLLPRLIIFSLLLLLAACAAPTSTPSPNPDLAYTLAAQTLDAQLATVLAQTQEAGLTLTALVPTATVTPSPIPPTFTPSPTVYVPPTLVAASDTNCRQGPGFVYDLVGVLSAGVQATVIGRSQDEEWLLIAVPDAAFENCWVQLDSSMEVTGDLAAVPFFNAPPTPTGTFAPTPVIGFTLQVNNIHDCDGVPHAIFTIRNTGPETFLSAQVEIRDLTTDTSLSVTDSNNPFMASSGDCPKGNLPLAPGETGYLGGPIAGANPGDTLRAIVRACTGKALSGACVKRTVQFAVP